MKRLAALKGFDTQQKLAVASGLSQPFIALIFADKRPNLTASVLYKLCDALGVGCDHFRPFLADGEAELPPAEPEKKARKG